MTWKRRPRVAFVVPRFGKMVCGGAETHCRLLTERLKEIWDVQVLTTCASDYLTWRNEYPPGQALEDGLPVHRFPVSRPRDMEEFVADTLALEENQPSIDREDSWMRLQGPDSPELIEAVAAAYEQTDLFIFVGYLYASTYFALPRVAGKSVLIPMAHDEPPLRLHLFDRLFERVRRFLFNSLEEQRLLERRFGIGANRGLIVGAPIAAAISAEEPIPGLAARPFVLYLGRIDYPKGCADLFHSYVTEGLAGDLDLVLAGEAKMVIPENPGICYLGFVPEEVKTYLLRRAVALVQPSIYESLSLTALEAWNEAVPVLARRECAVLRGQCHRSGGGLLYSDGGELAGCVHELLKRPARRLWMGYRGRRYVRTQYSWDHLLPKFRSLIPS